MSKHRFSFIIPARRCNEYLLKETLPAFEAQTYPHFEVLIVADDTESFSQIIKKFSWLKILKSAARPGVKRDIGAERALGDILCFIDDDAYIPDDWLTKTNQTLNQFPGEVAFSGPGVLPTQSGYWEYVFQDVMLSWLGSGGYSYRFRKERRRHVDDYPSMNLLIKKDVFIKLGGFKNEYWPGEDSKLAEDLRKQMKKQILYDPRLMIYHHRRNSLWDHLIQHKQYGSMRGRFFAHGDRNSRKATYLIPSLFFLYLIGVAFLFFLKNNHAISKLWYLCLSPLIIYVILLLFTNVVRLMQQRNMMLTLGTVIVIPLTHIVYGYFFIKGYLQELLKLHKAALVKSS